MAHYYVSQITILFQHVTSENDGIGIMLGKYVLYYINPTSLPIDWLKMETKLYLKPYTYITVPIQVISHHMYNGYSIAFLKWNWKINNQYTMGAFLFNYFYPNLRYGGWDYGV